MPASPSPYDQRDHSYQEWLTTHPHGAYKEWVAERRQEALDKAVDFVQTFGINKSIPIKNIDAYLWMRYQEVPADEPRQVRMHYRKRFIEQIRRVCLRRELMVARGLETFQVHCFPGEWRLLPAHESAERLGPAKKMRSQTKTSARQQRQLLEGIDAKKYPHAHQIANIGNQMNAMCSKLMNTLVDELENFNKGFHVQLDAAFKAATEAAQVVNTSEEMPTLPMHIVQRRQVGA